MIWCRPLSPTIGILPDRSAEPRRCRIHLPARGQWRPPEPGDADAPFKDDEQAILCRACGVVITHRNQALRVNDRHRHAFFNRAGIAFEVRCFRRAQGLAPSGEPSLAFTWFPGYSWQILLCAACRTHLGWLFANSDRFYGLIATRIT